MKCLLIVCKNIVSSKKNHHGQQRWKKVEREGSCLSQRYTHLYFQTPHILSIQCASVSGISEDHNIPIVKSTKKYLSPRELADYCFNECVPSMEPKDNRKILMKHQDILRSLLVENEIDSLNVQRVNRWDLGRFVAKKDLQYPAMHLLDELQEISKSMGCHLNWTDIANAVAHEMTNQIAQNIRSLSADLGELRKGQTDKLVKMINDKTTRKLSNSEAQYLRSLVDRATGHITLRDIDSQS